MKNFSENSSLCHKCFRCKIVSSPMVRNKLDAMEKRRTKKFSKNVIENYDNSWKNRLREFFAFLGNGQIYEKKAKRYKYYFVMFFKVLGIYFLFCSLIMQLIFALKKIGKISLKIIFHEAERKKIRFFFLSIEIKQGWMITIIITVKYLFVFKFFAWNSAAHYCQKQHFCFFKFFYTKKKLFSVQMLPKYK